MPTHARLLPKCARVYPGLKPSTWYRVVLDEKPFGVRLETPGLGDPFLNPNSLFVFREHV